MAKLSDRQRKQIIAEYVAGDGKISQQKLAEKYNVSRQAISLILQNNEACEKLRKKKEQNTLSMLEWLDEQKETAQSLIKKILDSSEKNIDDACLRDKMGALKILSDVFLQVNNSSKSEKDALNEIVQGLKELK